jgi:hypothetical protein
MAALGGLITLAFALLVLVQHDMDPKTFILIGTRFSEQDPDGTVGYDGQFVYYIAENPLDAFRKMDVPSHRYKRVVYPALAWLFSFGGHAPILPWSMLVINIAAVGIGTGLLAALLRARAVHPAYALVYTVYIGTMFSVRSDLNEPVAYALGLGGWVAYRARRTSESSLLFALAGLTKEVALLFPLALALDALWGRDFRTALRLGLWSAGPYVLWYGLLLAAFREQGVTIAPDLPRLVPFSGLSLARDPVNLAVMGIWVLAPAAVAGFLASWDACSRPPNPTSSDSLLVILHLILVAFLPSWTWGDALAVLRVGMGVVAAILLWAASTHPRALPYTMALWGPTSLLLWIMPGMVMRA